MSDLPEVTVYSDGACSGNPGPGGWAAILISGRAKREISGGERDTTNNRMELTAAIEALKTLKTCSRVTLHTDSTYVFRGATEWLEGWKKRGWRRKEGALLNDDLWRALDLELTRHEVQWKWVKGHDGNHYNELADRLAVAAIPRNGKS